jgi:hypothetical protein
MAFVFGYGSLAQPGAGRPLRLAGWRRAWGVAMDNRVTIPGYKYYLDGAGGRPDVRVAFLDVVPDPAACVDGVVFEVADLDALDARERNYRRVQVDGLWLYTGLEEARERYAAGPTVVARAYLEAVRAAFGTAFGPEPEVPVMDLRRVEVPPA